MSNPFTPIIPAQISWQDEVPYVTEFEDVYFLKNNGALEAQHVFIEGNQLGSRWATLASSAERLFTIGETGFGTGLNFLLTWAYWKKHAPPNAYLQFFSCEKHPLTPADLTQCLALWPELQRESSALLEQYPILTPGFHLLEFDEGRVRLTLMFGDAWSCYRNVLHCGDAELEGQLRAHPVDAWFLNGFAPAKNPAMWEPALFHTLGLLSANGTTLSTFTIADVVRNGLESAGFMVKKIPGLGGKRDMLNAQFTKSPAIKKGRNTPWQAMMPKAYPSKRAVIIGAGLAGCFTAYFLKQYGWDVVMIDAAGQTGGGASGNHQAVLYPKLSAFHSPLTEFMLSSYVFALRQYQSLVTGQELGCLDGILQLAHSSKEIKTQASLRIWLSHYPELGRHVEAFEASQLAGIPIAHSGIWIPNTGWIDSAQICERLLSLAQITEITPIFVEALNYASETWDVAGLDADVVIIAAGTGSTRFQQTQHLPLKSIRGQISLIQPTPESQALKIPICGNRHILPVRANQHSVGATYDLGNPTCDLCEEDDASNLFELNQMLPHNNWPSHARDHWCGVRATTPDYLPLVGPVADDATFQIRFKQLAKNTKQWIPAAGCYYPGLFICAGFGSKGLTTIPLSAAYLAASIHQREGMLPTSLIRAISPARFAVRTLSRNAK